MQQTNISYTKRFKAARDFLFQRTEERADLVIILGSGLGRLLDEVEVIKSFPYADIPFFPISTVEGHSGELVLGRFEERLVWFMNGRFHFYEGYDMDEVVFPLRVLNGLGVKNLVVTNAAGGLNPDFNAGDLMLIQDIINLFPGNPLRGQNHDELGPRFPDMSEPLDLEWSKKAKQHALRLKIELREGVYAGVPGPKLESKAEVKYLRILGADAVGMSTVPEIIAAHHMSMSILAISVITNESIPEVAKEFTHNEVVKVANLAGEKLVSLLKGVIWQ
ncbi:purine-nucleoside phosphorylase [Mongoliibacter ruber]|uniref:Purine nucleoside phosphorylase n=1 Tax=Mongoliibacter ruber TaxID=1750599 RepID=A0A2T0WJ61_9BACT|nr:purine-nucleoside phosphorylase [Mongoliibacter ruber]PRY86692.1 purine-nucleoside phosphorylase [Mongoliibacter ruber]